MSEMVIEDFVEDPNESTDLFDCEYSPIDAVINQVTIFTGWRNQATENGDRVLVAFGEGYGKSAFFTDSKKLREVFTNPNRHYPFRAIIKVVPYGNMCGFRVCAPSAEITQDDKDNFSLYKRTKRRNR